MKVWQTEAGIAEGALFRSIRKGGVSLSDSAVWAVVTEAAKERFGSALRCPLPSSLEVACG